MSKGEEIVRVKFNPSEDSKVEIIKSLCANLINTVDTLDSAVNPAEVLRLKNLAIQHLELAAMYAVKAATV